MIELGHVYCFGIISKISQATGLRDPEYWCSLSPFNFLEAGCSGNHGRAAAQGRFIPSRVVP